MLSEACDASGVMDQDVWGEDVCVPDNQCFAALHLSLPDGGDYLCSFMAVLLESRVSVSGVKALCMTFVVVYGNDGSSVISLLKALSGYETSSRVKTQDLIMLVSPDDDGVFALFPSLRHCFWRSFLGVEVSSTMVVLLLLRGVVCFGGVFIFLSLFFFAFRLCAS